MSFRSRFWKALALAIFLSGCMSGQEVWNSQALVKPEQVVREIRNSSPDKPLILFVGFPVMYRAAHIPEAVMAGPASTPDGLAKLKNAVSALPHSRKLIIYCGCCPLAKCPNVRPAYRTLRELGFSHVEVLELDQNFHTDWTMKGYPVKRGS